MFGRVQGEVFIYDNVPGGAGYARAIQDSLAQITELALEMGRNCPNASCSGACYHCLLGYRNQQIHNLLDRELSVSVIEIPLGWSAPQPEQRVRRWRWQLESANTCVQTGPSLTPVNAPSSWGPCSGQARTSRIGIQPIHTTFGPPTVPAETGEAARRDGHHPSGLYELRPAAQAVLGSQRSAPILPGAHEQNQANGVAEDNRDRAATALARRPSAPTVIGMGWCRNVRTSRHRRSSTATSCCGARLSITSKRLA